MLKIKVIKSLIPLLSATSLLVYADDLAAIQQKLVSQYALTQPTADNTDIVTAGSVLVLEKGPLTMGAATNSVNPYHNTYKDGKIQNPAAKAKSWRDKLSVVPGMSSLPGGNAPGTRTFVPGEKMWVTKIDVKDTGVVFDLFTDAYKDPSGNDVRYKSSLTFPFPKGWTPTADQVDKVVAEVFKVQPSDDASTKTPAAGSQPAASQESQAPAAPPSAPKQSEAPPPPIAPPPPPTDQPPAPPKTIALGQTKDQVVASFGQPDKIIKLPTKETYVYKDMKVIFVAGKVSDIQ